MAIGYQTSATDSKPTSGQTLSIVLNSTAGDLVVIGIVVISTTVSSITDGGGNTYRKVGSTTNGTIDVELWMTDSVVPAGSGTITVTLVADGVGQAGAVAASYRNVAFAGTVAGTATGATSPVTSGSRSLVESGDYLLMFAGVATNQTFVAQNGSIRNQEAGSGQSSVFIDNTGAASVTDSATMTNTNWATVFFTLRTITTTDALPAMTDSLTSLKTVWLQQQVSDTMSMLDAVAIENRFHTYAPQNGLIWGPMAKRVGRRLVGVSR